MGKIGSLLNKFQIQYNIPFNYQEENSQFGNSVERYDKGTLRNNERYQYKLNPFIAITTFDNDAVNSLILNRMGYYRWMRELHQFVTRYQSVLSDLYHYDSYGKLCYDQTLSDEICSRFHTGKSEVILFPNIYEDPYGKQEPCIYFMFNDLTTVYVITFDDVLMLYDILHHNNIDSVGMQLLEMHFSYAVFEKGNQNESRRN